MPDPRPSQETSFDHSNSASEDVARPQVETESPEERLLQSILSNSNYEEGKKAVDPTSHALSPAKAMGAEGGQAEGTLSRVQVTIPDHIKPLFAYAVYENLPSDDATVGLMSDEALKDLEGFLADLDSMDEHDAQMFILGSTLIVESEKDFRDIQQFLGLHRTLMPALRGDIEDQTHATFALAYVCSFYETILSRYSEVLDETTVANIEAALEDAGAAIRYEGPGLDLVPVDEAINIDPSSYQHSGLTEINYDPSQIDTEAMGASGAIVLVEFIGTRATVVTAALAFSLAVATANPEAYELVKVPLRLTNNAIKGFDKISFNIRDETIALIGGTVVAMVSSTPAGDQKPPEMPPEANIPFDKIAGAAATAWTALLATQTGPGRNKGEDPEPPPPPSFLKRVAAVIMAGGIASPTLDLLSEAFRNREPVTAPGAESDPMTAPGEESPGVSMDLPTQGHAEKISVPGVEGDPATAPGIQAPGQDSSDIGMSVGPADIYSNIKESERMGNQQHEYTCGAQCALQLLKDLGVDVESAGITEDTIIKKSGVTLGLIQIADGMNKDDVRDALNRILQEQGANITFRAVVLSASDPDFFLDPPFYEFLVRSGNLSFPFIARTGGHFIIVDEITPDGVVHIRDPWGLNGPGSGQGVEATLPLEKFVVGWGNGDNVAIFEVK